MARRKRTVPFNKLDTLPSGPAAYVVRSPIADFFGRSLYVGKTKRGVKQRMTEHDRKWDTAIPLLKGLSRVEYHPAQNDRHALALERKLRKKEKPLYGK
jgi:excinuclease UvrABC nuclease subunit